MLWQKCYEGNNYKKKKIKKKKTEQNRQMEKYKVLLL